GAASLLIEATAADPSKSNAVSITAHHGGSVDDFTAAVAVNTNEKGNAGAASISVQRLVDTTKAMIDGADVTADLGSALLQAKDDTTFVSIGGGIAVTLGAVGVGASVGFNQISATTQAGILGTDRRASLNTFGDVNITALNSQTLWAFAVSVGVSTGASDPTA